MLRDLSGLDLSVKVAGLSMKEIFCEGTLCDLTCLRRTCSKKEPRDHPGRAELAYARERQPQNPPWKPRQNRYVKYDIFAHQVSTWTY